VAGYLGCLLGSYRDSDPVGLVMAVVGAIVQLVLFMARWQAGALARFDFGNRWSVWQCKSYPTRRVGAEARRAGPASDRGR
jgi:hypothetical protein